MRHEWTDPLTGLSCAAAAIPDRLDGGLSEDDLVKLGTKILTIHGTAGREIVRLAERVRELEANETAEKLEAVIHALADALVDRDRLLKGVRDRLGLGEPPDEEFSIIRDQTFAQLDRIAVLEEENRELRAVILRDGDIRRVQPVFDQKIRDLEEENRRLRVENHLAKPFYP